MNFFNLDAGYKSGLTFENAPTTYDYSSVYNISVKCLQKKLKPLKQPGGEILSSKVWQCGKQLTLHEQQEKPDESKATFSACWKKTAYPTKHFKTEVEIKTFSDKTVSLPAADSR